MQDERLTKLKSSLYVAINKWMEEQIPGDEWGALDTSTSDFCIELMTDSAFNILLAQSDLTAYLKNNGQLDD